MVENVIMTIFMSWSFLFVKVNIVNINSKAADIFYVTKNNLCYPMTPCRTTSVAHSKKHWSNSVLLCIIWFSRAPLSVMSFKIICTVWSEQLWTHSCYVAHH